ncbi:MAG: RNA polymerase sigma-70 factor [Tannerella sp.]|nr:RNA polymerase sigma-70 factor [Tannerella sp.]
MDNNRKDIHALLGMIEQENRLAFNMFYDIYYDQVFRYAYYFLKDAEASREVVADVFFSVWQSRKKLLQIENMETYLFIAVRNEVTRYNKRSHPTNILSLDHLPDLPETASDTSTDDQIVYKEMEQLLNEIISELPEKCRIIFMMARQEGLKPKEIAEKLTISENTVRVQMKIAIDKIIVRIKPYYPDLTFSILLASLF